MAVYSLAKSGRNRWVRCTACSSRHWSMAGVARGEDGGHFPALVIGWSGVDGKRGRLW